MTLEKLKQLVEEDADVQIINKYIRNNTKNLAKLLDDTDPYILFLRCFFTKSLTSFIKTQFPWKMVQNYHF